MLNDNLIGTMKEFDNKHLWQVWFDKNEWIQPRVTNFNVWENGAEHKMTNRHTTFNLVKSSFFFLKLKTAVVFQLLLNYLDAGFMITYDFA